MSAIDIINKCIEETKILTQEEFHKRASKIKEKAYNLDDYTGGGFEIILPALQQSKD